MGVESFENFRFEIQKTSDNAAVGFEKYVAFQEFRAICPAIRGDVRNLDLAIGIDFRFEAEVGKLECASDQPQVQAGFLRDHFEEGVAIRKFDLRQFANNRRNGLGACAVLNEKEESCRRLVVIGFGILVPVEQLVSGASQFGKRLHRMFREPHGFMSDPRFQQLAPKALASFQRAKVCQSVAKPAGVVFEGELKKALLTGHISHDQEIAGIDQVHFTCFMRQHEDLKRESAEIRPKRFAVIGGRCEGARRRVCEQHQPGHFLIGFGKGHAELNGAAFAGQAKQIDVRRGQRGVQEMFCFCERLGKEARHQLRVWLKVRTVRDPSGPIGFGANDGIGDLVRCENQRRFEALAVIFSTHGNCAGFLHGSLPKCFAPNATGGEHKKNAECPETEPMRCACFSFHRDGRDIDVKR